MDKPPYTSLSEEEPYAASEHNSQRFEDLNQHPYDSNHHLPDNDLIQNDLVDIFANIFLIFDGKSESFIGKVALVCIVVFIFTGLVSVFVSTSPYTKTTPSSCPFPACQNVTDVCPDATICEPVFNPTLLTIGIVSEWAYLIEYSVRLLTCWAVTPRIAKADLGILVSFVKALPTLLADFKNVRPVTDRMSSFFPKSKFHSGGMPDESNRTDHFEDDMPMKTHKGMWGRVYAIHRRSQSFIKSVKFSSVLTPRQIHGPLIVAESFKFEENEQTTILQFIFFIFGIYNILDVLSFLPLFVDDLKPYVIIFRVFRLGRLYSIINDHYLNELLYNTLANSLEALVCIGIFSFFSVLLFSTLIYFTERGTFTVNVDYPNGAYLVPTVNDLGMQPTNFVSIPVSMYWAVTTLTTVGYGDLSPTTIAGRFIAILVMFTGVLIFALPISVISLSFQTLYKDVVRERRLKKKQHESAKSHGGVLRMVFFSTHTGYLNQHAARMFNIHFPWSTHLPDAYRKLHNDTLSRPSIAPNTLNRVIATNSGGGDSQYQRSAYMYNREIGSLSDESINALNSDKAIVRHRNSSDVAVENNEISANQEGTGQDTALNADSNIIVPGESKSQDDSLIGVGSMEVAEQSRVQSKAAVRRPSKMAAIDRIEELNSLSGDRSLVDASRSEAVANEGVQVGSENERGGLESKQQREVEAMTVPEGSSRARAGTATKYRSASDAQNWVELTNIDAFSRPSSKRAPSYRRSHSGGGETYYRSMSHHGTQMVAVGLRNDHRDSHLEHFSDSDEEDEHEEVAVVLNVGDLKRKLKALKKAVDAIEVYLDLAVIQGKVASEEVVAPSIAPLAPSSKALSRAPSRAVSRRELVEGAPDIGDKS